MGGSSRKLYRRGESWDPMLVVLVVLLLGLVVSFEGLLGDFEGLLADFVGLDVAFDGLFLGLVFRGEDLVGLNEVSLVGLGGSFLGLDFLGLARFLGLLTGLILFALRGLLVILSAPLISFSLISVPLNLASLISYSSLELGSTSSISSNRARVNKFASNPSPLIIPKLSPSSYSSSPLDSTRLARRLGWFAGTWRGRTERRGGELVEQLGLGEEPEADGEDVGLLVAEGPGEERRLSLAGGVTGEGAVDSGNIVFIGEAGATAGVTLGVARVLPGGVLLMGVILEEVRLGGPVSLGLLVAVLTQLVLANCCIEGISRAKSGSSSGTPLDRHASKASTAP